MKDQKEIYEALILGKTLVHTPSGDMVKIINGMQATKTGETWTWCNDFEINMRKYGVK